MGLCSCALVNRRKEKRPAVGGKSQNGNILLDGHFQFTLALLCCLSILCSCSSAGSKQAKTTAEIPAEIQTEIQKIVDADQELLRQANLALQSSGIGREDVAQTYDHYAQQLRLMDMGRCPLDFQAAYREYIYSVEDVATEFHKQPERSGGGVLQRLLDAVAARNLLAGVGILGDIVRANKAKSALERETETSMMKIRESRRKIELIALQHGVRIQEP